MLGSSIAVSPNIGPRSHRCSDQCGPHEQRRARCRCPSSLSHRSAHEVNFPAFLNILLRALAHCIRTATRARLRCATNEAS